MQKFEADLSRTSSSQQLIVLALLAPIIVIALVAILPENSSNIFPAVVAFGLIAGAACLYRAISAGIGLRITICFAYLVIVVFFLFWSLMLLLVFLNPEGPPL